VVFIHGGMSDECAAVVEEPALAEHYRVIDYHRRGWGNSSRVEGPISIADHAADCRAIMQHLGVARAHLAGQSYGGVIVLQVALDAPESVQSLALVEPPLPSVMFNAPAFGATMQRAGDLYASGDKAGAVEAFAIEVAGDDYRAAFDRTMPAGYQERWVAAADTMFQSEVGSLPGWTFTREHAARITQPVLNMVGAQSRPYFREIHDTLREWLPQAENVEIPDTGHGVFQCNPQVAAASMAAFFSRHAI
jgi:pimeloyl-ACP methyl ester carboxylesterase